MNLVKERNLSHNLFVYYWQTDVLSSQVNLVSSTGLIM